MSDPLASSADLLRTVRVLGLPAPTGYLVTVRSQRARYVRSLSRWLLVATPAGRARVRAWLDQGGPVPPVDALPKHYGDLAATPLIVAAVRTLPDAVRHFILSDVAFESVGFESAAWVAAACPGALVVRLSPWATVRTVLHECGHAWHRRAEAFDRCPTAEEWRAAYRSVRAWPGGLGDAVIDAGEVLADLCAAAWSVHPDGVGSSASIPKRVNAGARFGHRI